MKKYYVYVWIITANQEPFYVGKGSGNRYKSQKGRNDFFRRIINKHECESIIISPQLEEQQAFDLEKAIIRELRLMGYRLANMTDGEEGSSGRIITDAYREKYSKMNSGSGNPNYGHHWTQKMKDHMSDVTKQRNLSLDRNPKAHRVMCVETGRVYGCMKEPTDELGLKSSASITVALKNPSKTARGCHWVDGEMIDRLDSEEARKQYLLSFS